MTSHLLMLEDDTRLARMVGEHLGQSGFVFSHTANGGDGLSHLQGDAGQPPPDPVILDLMLPDTDGLEVCRRTRSFPGTMA